MNSLTVVVVTYRTPEELLRDCLSSLVASAAVCQPNPVLEVVIVENGTTDWEARLGDAAGLNLRTLRLGGNLGFGTAVNRGVRVATGEYVLLLNPDARLDPRAISALFGALEPKLQSWLAGCWVVHANDVQVDAYLSWSSSLSRLARRDVYRRRLKKSVAAGSLTVPVQKVGGGALFARREALERLGPFDESFFLYGEDEDLSRRAKCQGFELVAVPRAIVQHDSGSSSEGSSALVERARIDATLRLVRKHHGRLATGFAWVELLGVTVVGAVAGRGSSADRRSRWARVYELRRWVRWWRTPSKFAP